MRVVIEIFSNSTCQPLKECLEHDIHSNFYRAVAECEAIAGNAVSFINPVIAIVPYGSDKRIMISKEQ